MSKLKHAFFLLIILLLMIVIAGCAKTISPPSLTPVRTFNGITGRETLRASDGLKLFSSYWRPKESPKAILLVLHGTTFYGGVYDEFGKYMANHGYMVYAPDLRGWGQSISDGPRGYIDSFDQYTDDTALELKTIKDRYPQQRVYAVGESLGAGVAMYSYFKRQLPFDGMIFSGPAYKINPKVLLINWPEAFGIFPKYLALKWGKLFPYWRYGPMGWGIRYAVRDPQMQKRLLADPLVAKNWMPASYVTALLEADKYNVARVDQLDIPLFISQGEDDVLIDVDFTQELFDRVKTKDKTLHIYTDTPHATLVETKRYEVYRDILQWLDAHEKTSARAPNGTTAGP